MTGKKHESAQILSGQTSQGHKHTQRRTKRRTDGRRDGRTAGRRNGGRRSNHRRRRRRGNLCLKEKREKEREQRWRGGNGKRNHAWFTFNLSKGHSLPCGASARVRPLWAEQWVIIVLLVGVVGVVLGHGNWDGGGEELAPLPRILEAAERARLLLIPYIYKQDRHKEKNCREIWTQTERERVKRRIKEKRKTTKKWRTRQRMSTLKVIYHISFWRFVSK